MPWRQGDSKVTVENLKTHFKNTLQEKGIGTQEVWINKAINYLRYDNVQKVCRFALFVVSEDTVLDPDEVGLIKIGTIKSSLGYLEPSQWNSSNLNTVEHIAPQKPNLQANLIWDSALYENDDYQQIGNLTLLPHQINSSTSNKEWIEKWTYYRQLVEADPDKRVDLIQQAQDNQVNLSDSTIELLKNSPCAHHLKAIVEIGAEGRWDKAFVEKRTRRICDILWQRMYDWLA